MKFFAKFDDTIMWAIILVVYLALVIFVESNIKKDITVEYGTVISVENGTTYLTNTVIIKTDSGEYISINPKYNKEFVVNDTVKIVKTVTRFKESSDPIGIDYKVEVEK